LLGKPLVLHEQNSVAGMANKVLAGVADRVFTAFPNVWPRQASGWAIRCAPVSCPARTGCALCGPQGPLRVLVVGGSLGAKALNDVVPQALALLTQADQRPHVLHQSGAKQIDELRANYATRPVSQAETDALHRRHRSGICRGGPGDLPRRCQHRDRNCGSGVRPRCSCHFPFAVDDHQTTQCAVSGRQGGGWLVPSNTP
jgi:UDP-N-acetylglucosamine--N-acetylmuramyl-(pentapeptide) pyrophosphoryl-undecaprenol N-acetylglucosamine transferase